MNRVSDDYKKLHPAVHALVDKVDDFLAFKKNLKELRLCIGKQNSLYKTLDQLEGALAGHVILITDIKNGTSNIAYDALRDFLIDADRYDVMHQNIYNVLFSKNGIVACLHRLADHEDFKNSNEGNIPQILADFAYAHLKPVLENPDIMAGLQHFADNKTTIRRPVFAKSEGFHQQCIALHKEVGHILDNCNLMERHLPLLGLAPDISSRFEGRLKNIKPMLQALFNATLAIDESYDQAHAHPRTPHRLAKYLDKYTTHHKQASISEAIEQVKNAMEFFDTKWLQGYRDFLLKDFMPYAETELNAISADKKTPTGDKTNQISQLKHAIEYARESSDQIPSAVKICKNKSFTTQINDYCKNGPFNTAQYERRRAEIMNNRERF